MNIDTAAFRLREADNMSDLQDAINTVDGLYANVPDLDMVLEAARRVANPDYEAAMKAFANVQPTVFANAQHRGESYVDQVRAAVDAALGIEDE